MVHDGPQHAASILLIHGSGASGACWGPVVPALARDHHVVRIDLPGCGHSPPAASYDVPEQADRVAALLDDLADNPVFCVGHSSGGYVATSLAEQRPDLIDSLALVSSGPSPDDFQSQPAVVRALSGPPLGRLVWALRSDAVIRKGMSATFARQAEIPDELIADLRGMAYPTFRAVQRANGAYIAERSVPERLGPIDVPVLVIFGTADPRWDPSSAHRYDALPNARIEMFPGVGHVPMLEAPQATSNLLLAFADETRS